MQIPIHIDRSNVNSIQIQIFNNIRMLILSGNLRAGAPIPSSRVLAKELGVSRNTVVLAYDRLSSEGYLKTRRAARTSVSEDLPDLSLAHGQRSAACATPLSHTFHEPLAHFFRESEMKSIGRHRDKIRIDFWGSRTNPKAFPSKIWRRSLANVLARADIGLTEYGDPSGLLELRRAISDHLGRARGIHSDPDQIIIVHGVQEGLNIVARLFVREGTVVATENPCFQGATAVFGSYNATLLPIAVDENGMQVQDLFASSARLVYLTPSHQFPTGYSLPLERRLRLLKWAARVGAVIVEDDYDSDFRYDGAPIMALAALDTCGTVIYLGTFSKSLGPGLRVGYMVVPKHLKRPISGLKQLLNNCNGWLEQAVLANFVSSGGYLQHLRRIRQTYRMRRDCLVAALREQFGEVRLSGLNSGTHFMWHLPDHLPPAKVVERLTRARGVGVYSFESAPVYDYGGGPFSSRSLVLGFSSLDEARIREGVSEIAASLRSLE